MEEKKFQGHICSGLTTVEVKKITEFIAMSLLEASVLCLDSRSLILSSVNVRSFSSSAIVSSAMDRAKASESDRARASCS